MPNTDLSFVYDFFEGEGGVVSVVLTILWIIATWRIFSKAGYAGILAIIPIVNVFILVKVAGYSAWMTLLYLVPIANFIFSIFLAIRLGERFNKGGVWSFFLLWLFAIIGYFIVGFGNAKYTAK